MTSFSQRYAPPPRTLGDEIPSGVRRAIASWFRERDVLADEIHRRFFQTHGYGGVDDVAEDIRDRWGNDAYHLFYRDLQDDPAVSKWNAGDRRRTAAVFVSPFHVPAALYLDYLQEAIAKYAEDRRYVEIEYIDVAEDPYVPPVRYVNEVFAARGISYRFDENGTAGWHGDEGAYREVVAPALAALDSEYVAAARDEFTAALRHLRAGTAKDQEDAIEEAAKAVESMMKVALAERGIETTGRETAEPLWNMLRENGVVPPKTKFPILAAAQLRNDYGGHGAGEARREIPAGIPALAVQSAAAAIVYLATLLPPA
jgi:hypothetical protein